MPFPKQSVVEDALVLLIWSRDEGSRWVRTRDAYERLASVFGLSEVDLEMTRDDVFGDGRSEKAWANMVQFARRRLTDRHLLDRTAGRDVWRLSERGLQYAGSIAVNSPLAQRFKPIDVAIRLDDELSEDESFVEGSARRVNVNAYERDAAARAACIRHFGVECDVCGMSFESGYGPDAQGFIHVHHLRPLSEIGVQYAVDPIKDLRPVCPNCHAVIHLTRPPRTISEVKAMIRDRREI